MSSTLGVLLVVVVVLAVSLVTLAEISSPLLSFEAEQAQLSGQFTVGDDPLASGGHYVSLEAAGGHSKHFDGENVALFCFQIDKDGLYSIYADVLGWNEASNSFVIRIDFFEPSVWDFPRSKEYTYQAVTNNGSEMLETELTAGQHVVGFHLHEPGARLDRVDIVAVSGGHPKRCQGQSDDTEPNTTTSSTEAEESKGKPKGDRKSSTTSTELTSTTITDPTTTTSETTTTTQKAATTAPSTTTSAPSTTSSTAGTTTSTNPTTTAPPPVDGVVWSAGLESGNLSEWAGVTSSSPSGSSTDYGVASNLSRSGKYSLYMSIEDSVAGTGVRVRVDDNVSGYSGGENLPDDGYYSAWFYIPEHVTLMQGDNWNIYQWKQTCDKDGSTTRCFLESIKLVDLGGRYGFRLRSRTDSSGNWGSNNRAILAENTDVTVRAGEWFHVESRRVYDSGFNGQITTWINGRQIWDVTGIRTEHDWGFPDWRRQWTVNNYNTGSQSPNTQTIYLDDARIALNRQGP